MNERECSERWVDWIGDVAGIVDDAHHRFAYPVANVLGAPPVVAGVADRKRTAPARDEEAVLLFPQLRLQQVQFVRIFTCSATIMVEVEQDTPDAEANEAEAKEQFQILQGFGAALEASALGDDTLGGRLDDDDQFISPALSFDYTPVFRELDDGTRGRTMAIEASIAEIIVGPE